MSIDVICANDMSNLLNSWYVSMRDRNLEKSHALKEEIEEKIERKEENENLLLYYSLLDFRHSLLTQPFTKADDLLIQIDIEQNGTDDMLDYYYHFFKGIYFYQQKHYEDAIKHYHFAERKLSHIPDPIETAEFHYQLASVYSQYMNVLTSIHHTLKALEIFRKDSNYQVRSADSKNLLGSNHILLGNFERAEVYLHEAIKEAQRSECQETEAISLQNLGWMYTKQDMPLKAIRYLERGLKWMVKNKEYDYQAKTMYLLAKEYFHLNEEQEAMNWIDKCYDICQLGNNLEYLGKLTILKAKHTLDRKNYMIVLKNEISSFFDKKNWENVEEFSQVLANHYEKERNIVEAMNYYKLVIIAKNKLKLEEGLG
ncbi:tetratricopeptide repeat protein [Pseudalkalibacillus decolorationis]|uniref:response regulator aspartate phosphatase n=1 Tax=Pseudalkalibacillus decolorationis TaxID=163879 RepID=UPI0021486C0F|nr:tetratricopeptide repeat protein [Pseudalkalibacillus decolorationis]